MIIWTAEDWVKVVWWILVINHFNTHELQSASTFVMEYQSERRTYWVIYEIIYVAISSVHWAVKEGLQFWHIFHRIPAWYWSDTLKNWVSFSLGRTPVITVPFNLETKWDDIAETLSHFGFSLFMCLCRFATELCNDFMHFTVICTLLIMEPQSVFHNSLSMSPIHPGKKGTKEVTLRPWMTDAWKNNSCHFP